MEKEATVSASVSCATAFRRQHLIASLSDDEDSEGSASYSFQDDSLSDDEDSEGSASYESASYASYESNNLSANGDQDGTLVNASSSATAVPLVLIVLAVAVAGAALVAARSRQQGAGMIRERTKNM